MKTLPAVLATTLFLSVSVQADEATHSMPGMKDGAMPSSKEKTQDATLPTHHGKGTVNSVDVTAGKVNLSHEPIESLGWKSMTMGFPVQNPALLKNLKPGAQVEFDVQKRGEAYLITSIKPLEKSSQN